ncbi:hypothetical protein HYFRA_00013823 [Hymenoscyphus fraxineus]|uniref:DUF7730 domain-containing protein n=1 Tax=Hymenoscyphus fraxineus TaxID=746836 RepID=A0A9N9LD97_9HELO|nr:hypothetical protein HYFRA_00013823 [Hymenoscyphus fraxineus]
MAGGYRSRPVSLDQSPHVCGDQLMQTTLFNNRGTLAIYNPSTQDQPSLLSIPATTTTTTKSTATPPPRGLVIRNHGSCKVTSVKFRFEDLPAEIRLQIYRLLLIAPQSAIRYLLCVWCKRIMVACQDPVDDEDEEDEDDSEDQDDHNSERDGDEQSGSFVPRPEVESSKPMWQQHFVYPSILQCSRLIYSEGMPILYGENTFALSYPNLHSAVCYHSWQISSTTTGLLRHARIFLQRAEFNRLLSLQRDFAALKELEVQTSVAYDDWQCLILLGKLLIRLYDKITFLRAIEYHPHWDESKKKYQYQVFHPSFNDRPGGKGICYTTESSIGATGVHRRDDYIPPCPRGEYVARPELSAHFPGCGFNGVLRVIISRSETKYCAPLKFYECDQDGESFLLLFDAHKLSICFAYTLQLTSDPRFSRFNKFKIASRYVAEFQDFIPSDSSSEYLIHGTLLSVLSFLGHVVKKIVLLALGGIVVFVSMKRELKCRLVLLFISVNR